MHQQLQTFALQYKTPDALIKQPFILSLLLKHGPLFRVELIYER